MDYAILAHVLNSDCVDVVELRVLLLLVKEVCGEGCIDRIDGPGLILEVWRLIPAECGGHVEDIQVVGVTDVVVGGVAGVCEVVGEPVGEMGWPVG